MSAHEIGALPMGNFVVSHQATQSFLDQVAITLAIPKETLNRELSAAERERLRHLHDLVPTPCLPLYFFTAVHRTTGKETVTYVGKTNAKSTRWQRGHSAATKLLDPKFNKHDKVFYQAQILVTGQLEDGTPYSCPLEWLPCVRPPFC